MDGKNEERSRRSRERPRFVPRQMNPSAAYVCGIEAFPARHALHGGTLWRVSTFRLPDDIWMPTIIRFRVAEAQPDKPVSTAVDAHLRHSLTILPAFRSLRLFGTAP